VALCDLDENRLRERLGKRPIKTYTNYHHMLTKEEVDVVGIMTPSGMHTEHAIDVIQRYNKHIVLEKPMALSVELGQKLNQTVKNYNVKLFVVHQNRFNKAIQKIKSAMQDNYFGNIALATVRVRWSRGQSYFDRDPWRGTWAFDGGALTNQSIHHIDLLRWFMGEVESVSAIAKTQFVSVDVEDTACAWIRFKNGAIGAIEATTATRPMNHDLEASISILGENGVVIVEGAAVNKLKTWTFGEIDLNQYSENPPNVYGYGHNVIIDNVVEVLLNGGEPLVNCNDALESIKLLSAIYRSIELDGKEVLMSDNPVSERLGIIKEEDQEIAGLYRTPADAEMV
jgi:predicted dehydrogenase